MLWHAAEEQRAPVLGALVCGHCPSVDASARASRMERKWRREHGTSLSLLLAAPEVGFVADCGIPEGGRGEALFCPAVGSEVPPFIGTRV